MTKLTRIEEVKKILEQALFSCESKGDYSVCLPHINNEDIITRQIDDYYCQLFPQPLEKCPKCDGSGRVYICVGQMNEFYEKCPNCKGSGKTPQPQDDKELREKIVAILVIWYGGHNVSRRMIDRILALLQPKIEEAKREDRERIIELVKPFVSDTDGYIHITLGKEFLQALKGGE